MNHCPICRTPLNDILLLDQLPAHQCPNCAGIWLKANEYFSWLSTHQAIFNQLPDMQEQLPLPLPLTDSGRALICPDCGTFLRRFQVWPNATFHLDRCANCNGVWLDKNEWQTLKTVDLHTQINTIFTKMWQTKLRDEESRQRFEKMYQERFGTEDYEKIKIMREWLAEHPNRGSLTAYLTSQDPYKF